MKRFALLLSLLTMSFASLAGTHEGKITHFIMKSDNTHYFYLSGIRGDRPECATQAYWVIKDENSVAGKSQISALMLAYSSNRPIRVEGTGACTRWPDGEDVYKLTLIQ